MNYPARILIGDAAQLSGLSRMTLRRLDRRGVVQPRRDLANRRVYAPIDIEKLRQLAGLDPAERRG
jgi:DNA-binding transcriptional MerR regulator